VGQHDILWQLRQICLGVLSLLEPDRHNPALTLVQTLSVAFVVWHALTTSPCVRLQEGISCKSYIENWPEHQSFGVVARCPVYYLRFCYGNHHFPWHWYKRFWRRWRLWAWQWTRVTSCDGTCIPSQRNLDVLVKFKALFVPLLI